MRRVEGVGISTAHALVSTHNPFVELKKINIATHEKVYFMDLSYFEVDKTTYIIMNDNFIKFNRKFSYGIFSSFSCFKFYKMPENLQCCENYEKYLCSN